jgi:thioredoxin-dependent peroxiredoxin
MAFRSPPVLSGDTMSATSKCGINDEAPDFLRQAHDGTEIQLHGFRGQKNVVLYFYPADFTPVCTKESCGFRDLAKDLALDGPGASAVVIGVSNDSLETHRNFAKKYDISFPLLADEDRSLGRLYGAFGGFRALIRLSRRVTFVIDKQSKIQAVIDSDFSADAHIAGVKAALVRLQ